MSVYAAFTGFDVDCLIVPTRVVWRRWHCRFNACTSVSSAEAFDVLGPWGMMRELARARRAA